MIPVCFLQIILYYKNYSKLNLYSHRHKQKYKFTVVYESRIDRISLDYPGFVRWQHYLVPHTDNIQKQDFSKVMQPSKS